MLGAFRPRRPRTPPESRRTDAAMAARTPKPKKTGERPARRLGKQRFGLAGRVATIALCAAILGTLAQWIVTPILVRNSFDNSRLVYAEGAAKQLAFVVAGPIEVGNSNRVEELSRGMAGPLPGGEAVVIDVDGIVLGATSGGAILAASIDPTILQSPTGGVVKRGETLIGVSPVINSEGRIVAKALIAMAPRTLVELWIGVVVYSALVFTLALCVSVFFLIPIARRALKPVTDLERRIRGRDPKDKSKLADSSDDRLLKPLLTAIDEVHERSEAAMRRALTMAYTDPVTRLPNRLRFLSRLDTAVAAGQGVHLVICDLDRFRQINVTYGPRVADVALAGVAERLRATLSQSKVAGGFISRIGADQFGIILPAVEHQVVETFISACSAAVAEGFNIEGEAMRISASFGSAQAPRDANTSADLVKLAEVALKEAKKQTSQRIAFFDQRLLDKARAQSKLEDEVREGLERGEFVAVFQPKVKLETGELVGAEALARWRRPDGAIVSPGVFIPIAEDLGLIAKLGKQVMRDACFAAAGWNRRGIVSSVAVNVSPHQFDDPEFVSSVYKALDDSGLPPSLLELEITESAAVADGDRVARTMWPLRNRGVRLAIDDFGTGHSNFAAITRLPFDVFKIDQQFVRALSTDPHAPAIVEMILAMAEALGQETVAEGVETKEQADFLLRRACTIGQGYYYSPPLPADEFDAFVRSYRPRPADRFAA
jgi:diguanylate cyclase (GGDEF)-like protein